MKTVDNKVPIEIKLANTNTNEDTKTQANQAPAPSSSLNPTPPLINGSRKTVTMSTKNLEKSEKWNELNSLKSLYEEGFITVVEYRERKSQIIDALTGTSMTSRPHPRSRQPSAAPVPIVAKPPPDFSHFKEENAIKHLYDPLTRKWSQCPIKVKIDTEPFAAGGLRRCFYLKDLSTVNGNQTVYHGHINGTVKSSDMEEVYVAKISIDPFEDREVYFCDVEMQMHSKIFANKFNLYTPPKRVDFVKAWLLELIDREDRPLCGVERYIDGPYRKHNNNFGYVSEDERNTPQAFSHFTYEASKHKILICDIQGVGDLYTDPQMHTVDSEGSRWLGKGDMGARGIAKFLATHQCNAICRYLKLPLINAKQVDLGTVPATSYMSYQHIDVVNIEYYHPVEVPVNVTPRSFMNEPNREPLLPKPEEEKPAGLFGCCILL
eukprot:TRINITY_DN6947_c0_g1_i1.p1 TRINITY_DN6947_c0_g1~~TRINITY_DN6947_c0_g1_i1.p1  ORF type:complete len:435 (+),score=68.14 TRINITY_DN6947_c0_g1_i1:559-1863(+)